MNKLIVGLILGIVISAPILAKTIMNPFERVGGVSTGSLYTTKITTEEGTYRIFIYNSGFGSGITTVKIK